MDGESQTHEIRVSSGVGPGALLGVVDATVQLDDKHCVVTAEVDDVVTDLVLSAKLQTQELSLAEHAPHELFRGRRLSPKLAGSLHQTRKLVAPTVLTPSPSGRGLG